MRQPRSESQPIDYQNVTLSNANNIRVTFHARSPRHLSVNGNLFQFEYDVYETVVYGEYVFVLLDVPSECNSFITNIYGLRGGKQLWQVEERSIRFPGKGWLPFVGMNVTDDGRLIGVDFCGRRAIIDIATGAIIGHATSVK